MAYDCGRRVAPLSVVTILGTGEGESLTLDTGLARSAVRLTNPSELQDEEAVLGSLARGGERELGPRLGTLGGVFCSAAGRDRTFSAKFTTSPAWGARAFKMPGGGDGSDLAGRGSGAFVSSALSGWVGSGGTSDGKLAGSGED